MRASVVGFKANAVQKEGLVFGDLPAAIDPALAGDNSQLAATPVVQCAGPATSFEAGAIGVLTGTTCRYGSAGVGIVANEPFVAA